MNECWFWQLGLSVYREIWRHSALVQSSLHTLAKLSSLVEVAVRPSATPSDPLRTWDLAFQRHQSRIASFRSSVLGYSWCYLFVAISGGWGRCISGQAGLYDDFVMLLDFNSLYPSIIQDTANPHWGAVEGPFHCSTSLVIAMIMIAKTGSSNPEENVIFQALSLPGAQHLLHHCGPAWWNCSCQDRKRGAEFHMEYMEWNGGLEEALRIDVALLGVLAGRILGCLSRPSSLRRRMQTGWPKKAFFRRLTIWNSTSRAYSPQRGTWSGGIGSKIIIKILKSPNLWVSSSPIFEPRTVQVLRRLVDSRRQVKAAMKTVRNPGRFSWGNVWDVPSIGANESHTVTPQIPSPGIMVNKENHPKWPYSRLVKYYDLPRFLEELKVPLKMLTDEGP